MYFLSLKITFKIVISVDPEIHHLDIQFVNVTVEGFPIKEEDNVKRNV